MEEFLMKTQNSSALLYDSRRCFAVALLIFSACCAPQAIAQNGLTGLSDSSEWMISDGVMSDYILAANSGVLDSKRVNMLLELKNKSLSMRLKQSAELTDRLYHQITVEEKKAHEYRAEASKIDSADSSVPISPNMSVNEQLLYAALIENQKISWDVAAERSLVDSQAARAKPSSELVDAETQIAQLELNRLNKTRDIANAEYQQSKDLYSRGAEGILEFQKKTIDFEKADIDMNIAHAKLKLIPIRNAATEKQVLADASEQLSKLLARKKKIEEHIQILQSFAPRLLNRERLIRRAERHDERAFRLEEHAAQEMTKKLEIEMLIQLIETREKK